MTAGTSFRHVKVESNGLTISFCAECRAIVAASAKQHLLALVEALHDCSRGVKRSKDSQKRSADSAAPFRSPHGVCAAQALSCSPPRLLAFKPFQHC